MNTKGIWVLSTFLILLFVVQSRSSTDAAQIANYDIERCYEVDFTVHYNIPGGLTRSLDYIRSRIGPLFSLVNLLLPIQPACSGVRVTKGELKISQPGQSSAYIRQTVIFTATANVPDNNVASKLAACISYASGNGKLNVDSNLPSLSQGGATYRAYNKSTFSDKRSCCGGDTPPPCCAAGSIKVSSTKCGCVPGFHFVRGSLCVRCPNGTYQAAQGQKSCDQCPGNTGTFGKTGATSVANCTDNNPLQILDMPTSFLPFNPPAGTVVVNVTVTGDLALLVQPFIFYIETVTQLQQSRNTKKRRRRDMAGVGDVCEDAGTIPPSNYFCINRRGGQIKITRDFVFNEGDQFELIIRVTDSDRWGKTENTFKLKFISRDECKDVRKAYEKAVKFCPLMESRRSISCPPMNCLQALYTWQETLSRAIGSLNGKCSFDPSNMKAVAQRYSSCIGPPAVTLNPEPLKVIKGAPAVLTCNASSPLNITITWFKDGKPIQRFGDELKIDKVDFKDQGDYYCKFSTVLASTFSKSATVLLEGVLTSIVAFRIVNENYETDLLDPSSTRYNTLQIDIERSVENHLNSGSSQWTYEVKLSKFRELSAKVGVILVVYSKAKTEDFTKYYNNLERILVDGDINTIFSSLTVSRKSVTIKSATLCLAEKTGKVSVMGEFEWNLTRVGENSSSIICPYGPPPAQAKRLCGGNFSNGGVWENPDDRACNYKSERTNKLRDLTETPVDDKNVVQVTKEVKNLTSSPDDMNGADAALIADVIEDIVSLEGSLNETGQDVLDVIDNVMQMKREDLQESQRSNKASSKLVQALDKVATSLPLLDQQSSRRLIAPSVAIQTNRVDPGSFPGMSLAVKATTADPNNLTPESLVSDELPPEDVQTSITLPEVLFENNTPSGKAVKVGFVIYQNDKFFQGPETDEEESSTVTPPVTSKVISSSVEGYKVENLSQPLELLFEPAINMDESSGTPACVFWDFKALGGLGNWSDRGCKYVKSEAGRVKCQCDHMTSFAVLFSAGGPKKHDEEHALALSIISYVGCAISLVGLTITLATYALFRNLRKTNQQPILMSLCVSLMLLLIVFIAGVGRTENLIGCRIVAVLLHYFALSSVMWMGVEGYNMYMSFVKVMATYQSKFMLKASTVAWGLPAVIVVITLSAATSYYGNNDFCVLYGIPFQAAMFAPVLLIILVNFVIFILAIRSLNRTGALVSAEKKSTSYHRARTSVAILLLLGLTWVFGALAVSRVQLAFDYLFCIFNSLQGFLIFYFHCVRHQEVRNQWKWLLLGKGTRYHPSSSESRTGYPKTNSKANKNNISNNTPMRKSFEVPRKQTFSTNDGDNSSTLQPRPDVVPAEV